jgi:hypothetical protein
LTAVFLRNQGVEKAVNFFTLKQESKGSILGQNTKKASFQPFP